MANSKRHRWSHPSSNSILASSKTVATSKQASITSSPSPLRLANHINRRTGGCKCCPLFFLDKLANDFKYKLKTRCENDEEATCFSNDELLRYERNKFCRASMQGFVIGYCLLTLISIFFVYPISRQADSFRHLLKTDDVVIVNFTGTIINGAILLLVYNYLSAYIVLIVTALIVLWNLIGSFNYQCELFRDYELTWGNLGLEYLQYLSIIEYLVPSKSTPMYKIKTALSALGCRTVPIRLRTITLVTQLVNLALAIRMTFI